MCLDVCSWERAAKAMVFFDQYLKRSVTQVTHAAMVNRLFAYHGGPLPALEELMDRQCKRRFCASTTSWSTLEQGLMRCSAATAGAGYTPQDGGGEDRQW